MKLYLFIYALAILFVSCESGSTPNYSKNYKNPVVFNEASSDKTPLNQGDSPEDIRITQAVRKLVMADESLSINGKNVKIITLNGEITLKGPVNSEGEKCNIETKAKSIRGVKSVSNHLEVLKNK